jgi:O-6-methylguanine DNA methyltransferase
MIMVVADSTTKRMALIGTPWGMCGVVWRHDEAPASAGFVEKPAGARLCTILTPGLTPAAMRRDLLDRHPGCREVLGDARGQFHPEVVPEWFGTLARFLQGYYAAAQRGWTPPRFAESWAYWRPRLDWSQLTPFQRQVLEIVGAIPGGVTLTYGQIARKLGKPGASRAVGAAIGSNPWPVLVPCHRVMGATGKLTGFSAPGGVETKRRMLVMEGCALH